VFDPRITLPGSIDPPPTPPARRSRALAIAYEGKRLPLVRGDFLLGRAPTCHLAIDEMMVSRVHAKIVVTDDAVIVRDMNSTNGVFVNGSRIDRPTPLREGDTLAIGSAALSVIGWDPGLGQAGSGESEAWEAPRKQPAAAAEEPNGDNPAAVRADRTRKADAFEQLGAIADRMLAAGRTDMAERSLAGHLKQVLEGARDGREVLAATLAVASSYAMKFAEAKGDGKWLDYVFELHLLVKRPLDASLMERTSTLLRRRVRFDRELFARYRAVLAKEERSMALSDRVLCAKIQAIDPDR